MRARYPSETSGLGPMLRLIPSLETLGRGLLLAGLFLMVSGDGLTNRHMPVPAHAWPWLYLVPLAAAFAMLAAAGRIGLRGATHIAPLRAPITLLLSAFLVSAAFSREPSLSAVSVAACAGIAAFGWLVAQALEHESWHESIWTALGLGMLVLSYQVIAWRLAEGLHVEAFQILNNAWVGKLQLAWVFNLLAPFFLARCLSDPRPGVSAFSGITWLATGAATYVLFSRVGSLTFLVTAVGVCLLSPANWRRSAAVVAAGAVAGGVIALGSLDMTRHMVTSFLDTERNPGIHARLEVWGEAVRMFQDRPLTGVGLGTFDDVAYSLPEATAEPHFYRQGWHAHNVYLHLLAETGLLGVLAWCYLWAVVLSLLVRGWWRAGPGVRAYAAAALCSVLAFLTLSFTEVLIGARVHASLRMNLTLALLVVFGTWLATRAAADPRRPGTPDRQVRVN